MLALAVFRAVGAGLIGRLVVAGEVVSVALRAADGAEAKFRRGHGKASFRGIAQQPGTQAACAGDQPRDVPFHRTIVAAGSS